MSEKNSTDTFTYSEQQEAALDRLVDAGMSFAEARERLGIKPDAAAIGTKAVRNVVDIASRSRRVNTRGGRSYNEGSDSEHDPFWNGQASIDDTQSTLGSDAQIEFAQAARDAADRTLIANGRTPAETVALRRARTDR